VGEPFASSPAGSWPSRPRTSTRTRSSPPLPQGHDKAGLPRRSSGTALQRDGSLASPLRAGRARHGRRAILLVGDNFGAASSPRARPWPSRLGIRTILSTSFADIFRNNASERVLPWSWSRNHARLLRRSPQTPTPSSSRDLARRASSCGRTTIDFTIEPVHQARCCWRHGRDRLADGELPEIAAWEATLRDVDTRSGPAAGCALPVG